MQTLNVMNNVFQGLLGWSFTPRDAEKCSSRFHRSQFHVKQTSRGVYANVNLSQCILIIVPLFRTLIVDEGSQVPSFMLPILMAKAGSRVVVFGDDAQLPAVTAIRQNELSVMDYYRDCGYPVTMLKVVFHILFVRICECIL